MDYHDNKSLLDDCEVEDILWFKQLFYIVGQLGYRVSEGLNSNWNEVSA